MSLHLPDFKEFVSRLKKPIRSGQDDGPEILVFLAAWWKFLSVPTQQGFFRFESAKGIFAESLYKQRGKFARPFIHTGMVGIGALGVILAPVVSEGVPGRANPWQFASPSNVLSATTESPEIATFESDKVRDRVLQYEVQDGDTLSSIAEKFQVSQQTILWRNDLTTKSVLKPGQKIEILPVTGISHKVGKGETIYTIAKKYQAEPQALVDFPFNTFVNDETFALAVGQEIIVPDGIMPQETAGPTRFARLTPSAGSVTASGSFVWPTAGIISQGFAWYHRGLDIANRASPDILAADAGTVIVVGWPDNSGYGNRVIIDHGNGYQTLYGHMSEIYVNTQPGFNKVTKGQPIGKMGSTGRSTGIHLHFEIRQGGAYLNPLTFLK